ncbi:CoA transferase [Pigmentiphaga sp.]|uniref:CaiB/BaiF CoA transferase family protein n=1 Tax=Pigmentiphaga sp. TaxID=1977564 RepID=UPI00128B49DF|nr:CoA transferase [Pigmentiphaga sp.]MPS26171.1 CoA transferase [Alcaligenaceae bacterium SAGV5]MPS53206.1 CoA transferase [Alcaligenaceae bacterium SAGV3]MPT55356.1 CoA transferase [Alcaligenaceae bacterium]
MNKDALAGVKVLELGSLIAGPYAGSLLAQFGADVVKIEPPGQGDPLRNWRHLHDGTSLWWYAQSRNKKSLSLDLKSEEGQSIVRRLVAEADVLIENFRPGTLEKWNLGWEVLSGINPGLIMARISGYGQTGPASCRPGFAAIAECMGGLRYVTGYPDRAPVRVGISLGDTLASLYATIGILMALRNREQLGGTGQIVDVALYEAVFAVMESLIPECDLLGHVRERTGSSLPGIAPSNTYLCIDGSYVVIAGNGDAIFKRMMNAMGRPDLAQSPELRDNAGRAGQAKMLDEVISAWTGERPLDEVLRALEGAQVPCGRIYTAKDILQDEHYRAREMILESALPGGQKVAFPGIVPKLSATPGRINWLGPALGAHTKEILDGIDVSSGRLEELRARGLV